MTGRLQVAERAARGLCGEHVPEPVLAGRWGKGIESGPGGQRGLSALRDSSGAQSLWD